MSDETLTVEGDDRALDLLYDALDGVADDAESAGDATIGRHHHIEYLGPDDQWRSPDSFPLVVGGDKAT